MAIFLAGALSLSAVGCRSSDLVEAELRTRESELRKLKDELYRTELYNEALQREVNGFRAGATAKITPELASQTYTLKEIVLARQTGGYDDDGRPGDEALQVVLEPRDPDGHAIKAPGSLHINVLQISREGLKTPLSSWDITPEHLRRTWRSGLFSTGYYVVLPWKVWPTSSKLRVVARFRLPDDRFFEADKDITIRLPPGVEEKHGPILIPEVSPEPIWPEGELFPAPRTVPPDAPSTEAGDGSANSRESWSASWRRPSAPAVQLLAPISAHENR
jgi:hypothetical protein